MDKQWIDILITDHDVTLDVAGVPVETDGRASIAQDIKHMILETGILIELISERSGARWQHNINRLEMMVEEDVRIIPGTVKIEQQDHETFYLFAETTLGPLNWQLVAGDKNEYK